MAKVTTSLVCVLLKNWVSASGNQTPLEIYSEKFTMSDCDIETLKENSFLYF